MIARKIASKTPEAMKRLTFSHGDSKIISAAKIKMKEIKS